MARVLHMILDFLKAVITFPIRLVQAIIEAVARPFRRGKRP